MTSLKSVIRAGAPRQFHDSIGMGLFRGLDVNQRIKLRAAAQVGDLRQSSAEG